MEQNNTQRWAVQQVRNAWTGKWRWGVRLIGGGGVTHIPQSYGLRAAQKLANRLNREYKKRMAIVAMARNSYTIGV